MLHKSPYYRVSIKALVLDKSGRKFLILREDNGYWELPGGGFDWGENVSSCLRREIKEELNLVVTSIAKRPSYFLFGKNMSDKQSVNIVYEIKLKNLKFRPSSEAEEIKFVTPKEALKMNSFRNVKELARQLMKKQ